MTKAPHKPTMNDVARAAGVGLVTVSRVLNSMGYVAAETQARVFQAVRDLGYQPNELARALRGQKSRTIGVIVPDLYDPFYSTLAHSVSMVARERGYSVILAMSHEDATTECEEAQRMLRRNVEGMIIIPAQTEGSPLLGDDFASTPMVMLDRELVRPGPGAAPRFDSVVVNNQGGARQAIEHLVSQHGHKRIAFLGLERHVFTIHDRYQGYCEAMMNAGLRPEAVFDCTTEQRMLAAVTRLLARKNAPTALFSSNNLTTRFLLKSLIALGVKVPQQVAVVGFDDFELAELLAPTLTVVRQPLEQMGRTAAEMLFRRLRSEVAEPAHTQMLQVELVVRCSCGCNPTALHILQGKSA